MQEFVNIARITIKKDIIGKPSEKRGRKAMGLRMIQIYDCQVAFRVYLNATWHFLLGNCYIYAVGLMYGESCVGSGRNLHEQYVNPVFLKIRLIRWGSIE